MAFVPMKQVLEFYFPGTPTVDRFGNERAGVGSWESVLVASWWVEKPEELAGDSVLRTKDVLMVHCAPEDAPPAGGLVRTPDQSDWEVQGNVEDYNHGWHGWSPDLVVVQAVRVEG